MEIYGFSKAVFFPRLTVFRDLFEGHPPRPVIDGCKDVLDGLEGEELSTAQVQVKKNIDVLSGARKLICVSCWHNNPSESAAMWDLYLKQGEGIAIRTTFERFKAAFQKSEIEVNGGLVKYIDYNSYEPEQMNAILWAVLKRIGFEHEREFRGIIMDGNITSMGVLVNGYMEILIEDIFVSPSTPDWMVSLLQNMLDKYGFKRGVKRSELGLHPIVL